jgi:hypothetical protein
MIGLNLWQNARRKPPRRRQCTRGAGFCPATAAHIAASDTNFGACRSAATVGYPVQSACKLGQGQRLWNNLAEFGFCKRARRTGPRPRKIHVPSLPRIDASGRIRGRKSHDDRNARQCRATRSLLRSLLGCRTDPAQTPSAPPAAAPGQTPSPAGAKLYFINLKDGQEVSSPFLVQFGLSGMGAAARNP